MSTHTWTTSSSLCAQQSLLVGSCNRRNENTKECKCWNFLRAYVGYTTARERSYAAKRVARGTFRKRGEGLGKGHIKPKRNLKFNTGARSINVAAAISAKKLLMFHVRNGQAASDMYRNKLAPALRAAYPRKVRFNVLEDNDPSGYKSHAGRAAKRAMKLDVLELPKRSPDLNPLDYGFWAEVNRRMRLRERTSQRLSASLARNTSPAFDAQPCACRQASSVVS